MTNLMLTVENMGEAVVTAGYLVKRCLSSAIELKTHEENWLGRPPDLSNLRVFGYASYAQQSVGKLEPRAIERMFLGYQEGTKGYRLWVREQGGFKILISRDVIFHAIEFPCLSKSYPNSKDAGTFNPTCVHIETQ
ncbi:uncharacterized protein LOC115694931 [Cannabis sativa]|uniref:uncharacterized protein LOC115694931 n=1 Tax=Cannabis sativa TaxID=3483 RepID=UPI0011DF85FA|nr:uncharacterized protein LOC115694931 [Cannabis sativa]